MENRKALILHGTGDDSKANWFGWLKRELEKKNIEVWLPDLPEASKPSVKRYNKFLFSSSDFHIDANTILTGHSSGAVAILGLLQALPENVVVDSCFLVGAFKDDLGWESLTDLFEIPFDFEEIKKRARKFVFVHSDNDPYCPLEHAEYLSDQLGGELVVIPDQKHFSVSTAGEMYREFPDLLKLIFDSK